MSQAVKRACDACHRRKVKCDGINPCRNCSSAQLSCTYNAIPQKKGPKGSRAKVISELRETQRQTSLSAKVQNRMNGIACPPSHSLTPTPGLLTAELVKDCVQFFFDNLYPQVPILDRRVVEQQILYMDQNRDAYCLLTALCAFVMLQPGMTMPPGDPYNLDMVAGANIVSSQLLVEEALRVRKGYEYLDTISLNVLATNYFLFGCCYAQEMHDRAWYHLREASTMIHMVGMNKEDHFLQFDVSEAARRRRLYWLYYATERAYALQRGRPLTLDASINPPTMNDDPSDPMNHQLNSFLILVDIYRPITDTLISVWNKTRGHLTSQYMSGLQKQHQDLVQSYMCQDPSFGDVRINQQWLKTTIWQLSSNNASANEAMSFPYPMHLSRELLVSLASHFPGGGIEHASSGLVEKLIETSYTLSEYLYMQPASRDPFALGPREYLNQILSIVAMSRNSDNRFLPLLLSKVVEILPRLINPMLQNAPENTPMANMDMFDGFGTAGMAQPAAQLPMSMDAEYDRKFPVEEYDKKYTVEVNGSPDSGSHPHSSPPGSQAPHQPAEINTSFVSSPAIMSPGMEYPHGMNNFGCTPVSEMVMSPMSANPAQNESMNPPQSHQQLPHGHGLSQQQQLPQQQPPQQQQQHHSMSSQGMHNNVSQNSLSVNSIVNMRPPQPRQGSFHMPGQPTMRTVGDFHGLQRANSELAGLNSMNNEIDFSALR